LLVYLSPAARADLALPVHVASRREIVEEKRRTILREAHTDRRNREVESDRHRNSRQGRKGRPKLTPKGPGAIRIADTYGNPVLEWRRPGGTVLA